MMQVVVQECVMTVQPDVAMLAMLQEEVEEGVVIVQEGVVVVQAGVVVVQECVVVVQQGVVGEAGRCDCAGGSQQGAVRVRGVVMEGVVDLAEMAGPSVVGNVRTFFLAGRGGSTEGSGVTAG